MVSNEQLYLFIFVCVWEREREHVAESVEISHHQASLVYFNLPEYENHIFWKKVDLITLCIYLSCF